MIESISDSNQQKHWWHIWSCKRCDESLVDSSEATRNKILMAAFEEIHYRGFQAASLNNILKNTGITKGALYHHFKNKLDLGYAVVDEVIYETVRKNWIEPLNGTDDPLTTLQNILIESSTQMTREDVIQGCPLNNLSLEMSPIDEGFRERISLVYDAWQKAIEEACERGKLAGNFHTGTDCKQLSLLFVVTIEGCMGYSKSTQSLETLMNCGKSLISQLELLRPGS